MSFEDFKTVIDKIPTVNNLTITGGEPFIHPNLIEMVNYCCEKVGKPRIVTSGYSNLQLLEELKDHIELLTVSLKYPSPVDETWRKAKGSYDRSIKFLEKAYDLKIPLALNWIVDTQNWQYLYQMIKLASKFKAVLEVVRFVPFEKHLKVFCLDNKEWEDICRHTKKFANTHIGFPSKHSYQLCVGGVNRIYIRTDGSVTPCIYSMDVIGNIFKDDWTDIELGGENWRKTHQFFKGKVTKGCIGFLKEIDPEYKKTKLVEMKIGGDLE